MQTEIPESLRSLQEPWLEGIDSKLETVMRVGGDAYYMNGKHILQTWYSGGAGTVFGKFIDEETYNTFKELQKEEFLQDGEQQEVDLVPFLGNKGVQLTNKQPGMPTEVYGLTQEVYDILPEHHFGHDSFKELKLGDWGGGAAKFSAFKDPTVHMFTCAVTGSRRNYLSLLLHETGHSFEKLLMNDAPRMYRDLEKAYRKLGSAEQTREANFGIDFLHGTESRVGYYLSCLGEFVAETYLMYVATGDELRDHIKSISGREKEHGRTSTPVLEMALTEENIFNAKENVMYYDTVPYRPWPRE